MSTDKTEKNPLVTSMPELNRRLMGLFKTAEAEADTSRGALDAAQIANTSGRLVSTVVKLANNRREKVDGEWLAFMDPDKVKEQHAEIDAQAGVKATDLKTPANVGPHSVGIEG